MSAAMTTLAQVLAWLPGARAVGELAVAFNRVHSDTRTLQAGDLFVAIKGDTFDANQFLTEARAKGAVAALCESEAMLAQSGLPGLVVANAKLALGQLAKAWRTQFNLPLIAVTGSNGKTTVTQMIASILRANYQANTLATQGNYNNDIGVPLTLLRLRAGHQMAVVELGMNQPGEIALLAAMAMPTVALVNNAQREHLEFMASVDAVARENGSVIQALPPTGVAVFPHDDAFTATWRALAGQRQPLTFAMQSVEGSVPTADVLGTSAAWADGAWQVRCKTPVGDLSFALHIAGQHNVKNALAAVACTLATGVPLASIAQGLQTFEPVKGRSRAVAGQLGAHAYTLIDDTYNANPDSVRAAIDVLAALPGPRLLVLGDMGEVGQQGPQFHAEVGAYAHAQGIETLFTLGDLAAGAAQAFATGQHFKHIDALNAAVLNGLPTHQSVLVKGSRFMQMERVVQALAQSSQSQQTKKVEAAC
jgi:UDP-N-acetylmuramoyl-tripeptide--D-alanyl-D-alanine ligase